MLISRLKSILIGITTTFIIILAQMQMNFYGEFYQSFFAPLFSFHTFFLSSSHIPFALQISALYSNDTKIVLCVIIMKHSESLCRLYEKATGEKSRTQEMLSI